MNKSLGSFLAAAILFVSAPSLAQVQLDTIVTGLASPLFAGHAGDGTNRLFIVERGGVIKVLQPGSSTPTVFLDIHTSVLSGGEQGLLGLAFHPDYSTNRRFFVYYTQQTDGTIVIAEYHTSTGNPNVANTAETRLLTIAHPTNTNHNGGMIAFGPDGYLYAGVGDGGSSNDPPNNAQNINVLLGKILRIDVDIPDSTTGRPYSSPSDNPYFGSTPGLDEIFSIGWRNPWRFSFDRETGQQWVADVGQGTREEVNSSVVNGGNYGWRIWEGNFCTGNGPGACTTAGYIFPLFDYMHTNNRCSITGGYVYRGSQGVFEAGTYIYGDYCTGEIFTWNGSAQTLLMDTALNISSFGEDEAGEVYVVGLGGTLSKLTTTTPCTYAINPASQSFGTNSGTGTVSVTAPAGCTWNASSNDTTWLHVTSGASGSGNGSVGYSVDINSGLARSGTLTVAGKTFTVNQAGVCTYVISPTNATFTAAGGTRNVTVTAPPGCTWSSSNNNVTWLHTSASGSGNGTAAYTVDQYIGKPKRRTGTLTIAGQTLSITQTK